MEDILENISLGDLYNPEDYYDTDESDFIKQNKSKFTKSEEIEELEDLDDDLEIETKKKKRKRRTKEEIEKDKHYLDDKFVTSVLMRDMRNGKVSNELAEIFMTIQEHILRKPNFSGYYGGIRENMISNGTYLFLKNWDKFKPYRVKNNYSKKGKLKVTKDSLHKSRVIYVDTYLRKYDMIDIMNRTYTVESCKKYKHGYKIHLFNKLKCDIPENTEGFYYKPKFIVKEENGKEIFEGDIGGGFTLLSMFAFTAAKNEITANKNKNQKMQEHLEKYNSNVLDNLVYIEESNF